MDHAIKTGNLSQVEYLIGAAGEIITERNLIESCRYGHIDIVKYLCEDGKFHPTRKTDVKAMLWACQNGHLDVVKYLFELLDLDPVTCHWHYMVMTAEECGNIDTADYLRGIK